MVLAQDLDKLPPPARRALAADAPAAMRNAAARGLLPGARPAELVLVLATLAGDADAALAAVASGTLSTLAAPILSGALGADLDPLAIEALASARAAEPHVLEALVRMPRIDTDTLERLAAGATEQLGEVIATNEERLLGSPRVIEKLYMNPRVRMSTSDRLIELAVRNGVELQIAAFKEASIAIQEQLISEPAEEPNFDDVLFVETARVAESVKVEGDEEDVCAVDDEGAEQVKAKFLPVHAQLTQMSVTQKIRRAMLGTGPERMILVRDTNRLVSSAAAKSPMLKDSDAALIASSRAVSDEVLRIIAQNKDFTRHYRVKLNLVLNPRTPFTFSSRLIPHLRDNDLRALSKSKNVPQQIQSAVRQQLERKAKGKS